MEYIAEATEATISDHFVHNTQMVEKHPSSKIKVLKRELLAAEAEDRATVIDSRSNKSVHTLENAINRDT